MPTPAFGFSVGDFVTGIGALITISKALKETDGAASEYQDVIFELDGLVAILQRLQASHSTRPNLAPGNAIWALAAECQRPIQKFLKHIEKYEKRLGKSSTSSPSSAFRKAKWALVVRDEVKDLRASIGPQLTSISLLLCIEVMDSQTVVQLQNTNIETLLQGQSHQSQVGFAQLNDKIEQLSLKSPPDHQPALTRLTEQVVTGCTEPRNVGQQNLEATHAVLDVLADIRHTIQSVHHSIERRPPSQVCPSASERDTHDEYASPSTPLTMVTKVYDHLNPSKGL
ncbi:MAG: hypothetical protein M1812_007170 [Candelaria pacifica]|nr:MAG: hypothetical protein M1812_007170 [Candelaria pacifica]